MTHAATNTPVRPAHRPAPSRHWRWAWLPGLVVVGGVIAAMTGHLHNPFTGKVITVGRERGKSAPPTVKVITPRKAAAVPMTLDNLAIVEPYYRADLRARASGIVRRVLHDIGDKVKAGEVLLEIDVPESEQDVARAEAMILQRQQEQRVSEARLKDAQAARDVSAATIKQRLAEVEAATATRDLRKRKYERFKELAARGSVVGNVVEEEERDYLSAEAAVSASKANVERARADFAESESKVEAAAADIDLKKAQIVVARKEMERARAVADFAKVVAPFDGVVVRRAVDPGSFVQNATSGSSEALISIARVDLVTVAARFPDSVAPYVNADTEVRVQVDGLAGVAITGKVTRFAPSVQNADRTMRVEFDLFNGDEADYARLVAALKDPSGPRPTKGTRDSVPSRAFPANDPSGRRLIPGMTGTMTLTLGGYGVSYVLPSHAVYSRGGANYVLLVENGKTRQAAVRVQLNDGKTSRIVFVSKAADASGQTIEKVSELTGTEQIVAARQLEYGDGATVQASPTEW